MIMKASSIHNYLVLNAQWDTSFIEKILGIQFLRAYPNF